MMIKQTLFTNWHFMRWLRLGLGVFLAIQAFYYLDAILGLASIFFLYQAATNTGCCGAYSCNTTYNSNQTDKTDHIDYEELKSK